MAFSKTQAQACFPQLKPVLLDLLGWSGWLEEILVGPGELVLARLGVVLRYVVALVFLLRTTVSNLIESCCSLAC